MATQRSIVLCIILTLCTCGIYGIYWFIKVTDEINYLSGNDGDASGVLAFILTIITCGIYGIYWAYKMGEKVDAIRVSRGQTASSMGIIYLIIFFLGGGIIVYALIQDEINKSVTM